VPSQNAITQTIRLINANQQSAVSTFLSGVIGTSAINEFSLTHLAVKICLKVSNEAKQRMTSRAGTPAVTLTKNDKVLQVLQQIAIRNLQSFVA
jgi:hypothetical protein